MPLAGPRPKSGFSHTRGYSYNEDQPPAPSLGYQATLPGRREEQGSFGTQPAGASQQDISPYPPTYLSHPNNNNMSHPPPSYDSHSRALLTLPTPFSSSNPARSSSVDDFDHPPAPALTAVPVIAPAPAPVPQPHPFLSNGYMDPFHPKTPPESVIGQSNARRQPTIVAVPSNSNLQGSSSGSGSGEGASQLQGRQPSTSSRSLAPSDSASNYRYNPNDEEDEEYGKLGGLGRKKSGMSFGAGGLDAVREEDGPGGGYGRGQGQGSRDIYAQNPTGTFRIHNNLSNNPTSPNTPQNPHHAALLPIPSSNMNIGVGGGGAGDVGNDGLSYIDEEGNYHRSRYDRPASMAFGEGREMEGGQGQGYGYEAEHDSPLSGDLLNPGKKPFDPTYPPPTLLNNPSPNQNRDLPETPQPKWYQKLLGIGPGKTPLEQEIEQKRYRVGRQRWAVVTWGLTAAMTGLMIWELISNNNAMGSPIATKPVFNYMIGPSSGVLINDGARFIPCMKLVKELPPSFQLACLNDTSNPPESACSLGSTCGFGGIADDETPNQWFRFIVPIFLHVGVVHFLLNMLAQWMVAGQLEREMGSVGFVITYFAGGIFGNVLGGNFSRTGIPSAGASGALFACSAVMVVDLALHWKYEERPVLKAFFLFLEFCVGIAIGYIPFAVDGMAHLGGYAMGLLCGMLLYPAILPTKRRTIVVWILRACAVVLLILAFVLTIRNFYTDDPNAACTWCKYLSCFPTNANNRCSGTGLETTSNPETRRSLHDL